jgi:hypothetical protein
MKKGHILGFAALLAWGVAKVPIETRLTAQRHAQQLGNYRITASLRQQLGQAGFLAMLGGLRAAVADLLWIRAHIAWQDTQYGRMKLYFDACTALQPRRENFWENAGWHMAWNGAAYMENTEPDPIKRRREVAEYHRLGESYFIQGTQNLPESWRLYDWLGALYRDKLKDPCKAAAAYEEASKREGHLDYTRRFAAYFLAECPGHEREAYEKLLALYQEGEKEWLPTLLERLQRLERKLGIPMEQRVYIPNKARLPAEP